VVVATTTDLFRYAGYASSNYSNIPNLVSYCHTAIAGCMRSNTLLYLAISMYMHFAPIAQGLAVYMETYRSLAMKHRSTTSEDSHTVSVCDVVRSVSM